MPSRERPRDYNGDWVFEPGTDKVYNFGTAASAPVVGDWNGDGRTKIRIYQAGVFILDKNGNGVDAGTDPYFKVGAECLCRSGIESSYARLWFSPELRCSLYCERGRTGEARTTVRNAKLHALARDNNRAYLP